MLSSGHGAAVEAGAGEILLTSWDRDGTGSATTSNSSRQYAVRSGCR